jgi:ParB/RepB/Spo0J family partition protein
MDNQGHVAHVEIKNLRECRIQLRPVDKRTVEYHELRDSIRAHGLWQPILIRPVTDSTFEVVDGFYRYNCCKELRYETVPCLIRKLSDKEVIIVQIQANAVRLETDPIDYAHQMWRIIKEDKEMTVAQMAHLIKKSPHWVRRILKITRLCSEVKIAVRRGQISITIAHEIAKVPSAIQKELLAQAMVIPTSDFLPIIRNRVRKFKEAIKTGRMEAYYRSFIEPVPHLRKMRDLVAEAKTPKEGASLLTRMKAETPMDGWRLCLNWVLHLDPDAVAEQKERLAKRHVIEEEQANLRKQDRENMRTGVKKHG